jgi:hypothetical protein
VLIALVLGGGVAVGASGCSRSGKAIGVADVEAAERPTATPENATSRASGEGFRFPNDRGGRALDELLRPGESFAAADPPSPRREFPPPRSLAVPEAPLSAVGPELARPGPKAASRPARPRPVFDEIPTSGSLTGWSLPEPPPLPADPGARVVAPDPAEPPPLPVLAHYAPERQSLDDPTGDFSLRAALAAPPPERTGPAPFLRLTLPDPFEHAEVVRLRTPLPEDPTPVSPAPRTQLLP